MRIELIDIHVPGQSRWWDAGAAPGNAQDATVFEDRWYALALYDFDAAATYTIAIGDETLHLESRRFTNSMEFERGVYFESASGATALAVDATKGGETARVFETSLYVVPSKIGWANYRAMVVDLQNVCRSLVMDVTGKSKAPGGGPANPPSARFKTFEEELQSVCRAARRLRPLVAEIRRAPKAAMTAAPAPAAPARCRSRRALDAMMKRGFTPGAAAPRSSYLVPRLAISRDIPEHRLIKAFLVLLARRIAECRTGIADEIRRLEAEGAFRSHPSLPGEASLYETEDLPKIRRLRERDDEALGNARWLADELSAEFWEPVAIEVFSPDPTQFAENAYYLEAVNIVLQYLRDTSHWGSLSPSRTMMAKKNSRMYEQWVLIQLVAAFSSAGLAFTGWDEALGRSIDSRFAMDLARNTTVRAPLAKGWSLVIRYEPWIFPKEESWKFPSETLCHFGKGNWSPDIVIELAKNDGRRDSTVYAIALDAKYSRRPTREMRENIRKYSRIRTTDGRFGRRVARQVWLVYPGETERRRPFWMDDEAMFFSRETGPAYRDTDIPVESAEQIFGEIRALPADKPSLTSSFQGVVPRDTFLAFAAGTLAFLRRIAAARHGT